MGVRFTEPRVISNVERLRSASASFLTQWSERGPLLLSLAAKAFTYRGIGHDLPSPLAGEGDRRADEGSLERGRLAERGRLSPSDPSSGASRHLLPQGEKGALGCGRESRRANAGFLLAETLATFTISAFVLLGLVSAASVLLGAVDRGVARVQDTDDLGRTMDAIARDVSGLARARWNGFEPQPFVFRGGPNSLYFARAEREPDGTRSMNVVALREVRIGAGTSLTRGEARLSVRAVSFDDLHYGPQRTLGTGAARLRFYYLPPSKGNDTPRRATSWPIGELLPAAILVEAIDRASGRVLATSRLVIRANADIGCIAKDGGKGAPPASPVAPQQAGGDPPAPPATPGMTPPSSAPVGAAAGDDDFCGRADGGKDAGGKDAGGKDAAGQPAPQAPPGQPPGLVQTL